MRENEQEHAFPMSEMVEIRDWTVECLLFCLMISLSPLIWLESSSMSWLSSFSSCSYRSSSSGKLSHGLSLRWIHSLMVSQAKFSVINGKSPGSVAEDSYWNRYTAHQNLHIGINCCPSDVNVLDAYNTTPIFIANIWRHGMPYDAKKGWLNTKKSKVLSGGGILKK
jgi:hypothetical protein